jgi:hypothetical protein
MNWLQIRLFGPYSRSFSTNSYGYYSQKSQNLFSNGQIFTSAQIVRQAARLILKLPPLRLCCFSLAPLRYASTVSALTAFWSCGDDQGVHRPISPKVIYPRCSS